MFRIIGRCSFSTKPLINYSFEIENGLGGIKRDRFLLLIGYAHFSLNDNKTRNV
jgi:hypothetical protein